MSLGPGTPISLMPKLSTPTSSISGGGAGPGPAKRTQAGNSAGVARPPGRARRAGFSSSSLAPRLGQYDVGRLLGGDVHGAGNEKPGNARKNRGVDNSKPVRAMHAKIAAQHTARLARTDGTAARGM